MNFSKYNPQQHKTLGASSFEAIIGLKQEPIMAGSEYSRNWRLHKSAIKESERFKIHDFCGYHYSSSSKNVDND